MRFFGIIVAKKKYLWLFGGGYIIVPMVQKYFVEKKKLFSEEEPMEMAANTSTFLYRFFQKHHTSKMVMKVLDGLRASSLGLIVLAAGTILLLALLPDGKHLDVMASIVFVLSLFALRKWKVNPILLMIVTGIMGVFIYV